MSFIFTSLRSSSFFGHQSTLPVEENWPKLRCKATINKMRLPMDYTDDSFATQP